MNENGNGRPKLTLVGGVDFEKEKVGISVRHRGVHFTRVLPGHHPQDSVRPLEESFAREWSRMNSRECFLESILWTDEKDPQFPFAPRTQREWEVAHLVAATVIQWLPTAVGSNFLRKAFQEGGGELKFRLPDWKEFSR